MRVTAKECVPKGIDDKKVHVDSKAIEEKKEENWIMPKHVPIEYVCATYRNAEEKKERRNNNRHEFLKCNDDD